MDVDAVPPASQQRGGDAQGPPHARGDLAARASQKTAPIRAQRDGGEPAGARAHDENGAAARGLGGWHVVRPGDRWSICPAGGGPVGEKRRLSLSRGGQKTP